MGSLNSLTKIPPSISVKNDKLIFKILHGNAKDQK